MSYTLLAISGSLRKESYNTALLKAFAQRAPEGVSITFADIGELPLFDETLESDFPEEALVLKNQIRAADGILISTPEYNRSMSGALKNALDWSSRPYGDNAWNGKPVFVMGASVGPIAAALAQYEVKKVVLYLNAVVLGQPEFYCGTASAKFDESGLLTDTQTAEHIDTALAAFTSFIERVR